MRNRFFFVALPFFFSADPEALAAGAPPTEAASAPPSPPNERGEIKAAAAEMKASALNAEAESIGIQNALEVVQFGVALAKAIEDAKKDDGKIDLKDIGKLFPVAPLVVPMINGIDQVPKELGDLDQAELEVLMSEAAKILGGSGAKTVLRVKAALKFASAGYELYEAFRA